MGETSSRWIDVAQLRRGLFIQLDLGWMDHPFPKGSFKITSDDQIKTILSLGVSQVRYFPDQSDAPADSIPAPLAEPESSPRRASSPSVPDPESPSPPALSEAEMLRLQRRDRLAAPKRSTRGPADMLAMIAPKYSTAI